MNSPQTDSESYKDRKAFFDSLLTIYGRKPVLEALRDNTLVFYKLHLAESNRPEGIIREIENLAGERSIEIQYHKRQALSRISRNGRQDQGVAADIRLTGYRHIDTLINSELPDSMTLIALDRITNPQNLGMIIRSVCASGISGLLLPKEGCAALSPLVIKASAGTLFRAPVYFCDKLPDSLHRMRQAGARIATLSSHASDCLFKQRPVGPTVYVLGNETEGVSNEISRLADHRLKIPMAEGVESLNVAVTAALIAYHRHLAP